MHHTMKTYGVKVQLHTFLSPTLDTGEWSTSHHCHFTPRERASGIHWIGGFCMKHFLYVDNYKHGDAA